MGPANGWQPVTENNKISETKIEKKKISLTRTNKNESALKKKKGKWSEATFHVYKTK